MRIKNIILAATASAVLLLGGCIKSPNSNTTTAPNSDAAQHNQDVSNTTAESNNVNSDVINATSNISGFGKNFSLQTGLICGATIDSSHNTGSQPYIIITYNGSTSCSATEIRTGQVKVQLISGAAWTDAGAVLQVTLTNYKVVYPYLSNASLTFNGSKTLTDVNGVNWVNLYLGTATASLRERCYNMQVTFDNGQTSLWETARLTTYSISNYTEVIATVNGDTTIGGQTIDSWGTTRFGTSFTTQMITPWQANSTCGWWSPTQGNYTSVTTDFTVSALFGLSSSGSAVTSGCAWGFKLSWSLTSPGSSSGSALIQYW